MGEGPFNFNMGGIEFQDEGLGVNNAFFLFPFFLSAKKTTRNPKSQAPT
jgi:hypothetical protein